MKTLKITISITTTLFMLFLLTNSLFAQLEFTGLVNNDEGGAGWNADGSGPEPYGDGHGDIFYYMSSLDYVDDAANAGGTLTGILDGFENFDQAIINNGYTMDDVKVKFALASLGDDIEGIDWFSGIGAWHYTNFYPCTITIEVDDEPMLEATTGQIIYKSGALRLFESGFLKVKDISDDPVVQNIANAFIDDLGGDELQIFMEAQHVGYITENGRNGYTFNVWLTLEKGLSEIPLKGEYNENEGFAGWDADGTGPEPEADGHEDMAYYTASVDYMDIVPGGSFCHFLDGQRGFLNTHLQLQYRGFEIGDLKLKLGLSSLGPDAEGEDYGAYWSNYYNNAIIFEINSEPILSVLLDTNLVTNGAGVTSAGMVYDISENASADAQFVAQSILKDLGTHQLKIIAGYEYTGVLLEGDGRDGAFYNIPSGKIHGIHTKGTYISEGNVSGDWTIENSPYYIEGPITVENGQTLEIEPGVRVGIRGPFPIKVQGCVKAQGTTDQPIMFTASNPNIFWDGFDYDYTPTSNETSVFDHGIFQYGKGMGGAEFNNGGAFAVKNYNELEIYNSVFRNNVAVLPATPYPSCGGAIALWNSSIEISHCEFYNNASDYGGAILCYLGSDAEISRNLFYKNHVDTDAGAVQIWSSNPSIINNTFSLNSALNNGGAMDVYDLSDPVFVNNIFWGNAANNAGSQIAISSVGCNPVIKYCDVEGGEAGIGPYGIQAGIYENNIDEDPLFLDTVNFSFLLDSLAPSPCIDTGDPNSPPDPDGSPIDMGCYCQSFETDILNLNTQDYLVYPNPATTTIQIVINENLSACSKIEVLNLLGQKVMERTVIPNSSNKLSMNITDLQPGIYHLILRKNDQSFSSKFIKK